MDLNYAQYPSITICQIDNEQSNLDNQTKFEQDQKEPPNLTKLLHGVGYAIDHR